MSMTQRYAGMLRRNAGEWDKREMPVQAECLRQAARHMEEREQALAAEIATLRTALRFYARGKHYHLDESEEFDTVSGEPPNWLMSGREDSATMVENGQVAKFALEGVAVNWIDGDDGETPQPLDTEVSCAA